MLYYIPYFFLNIVYFKGTRSYGTLWDYISALSWNVNENVKLSHIGEVLRFVKFLIDARNGKI